MLKALIPATLLLLATTASAQPVKPQPVHSCKGDICIDFVDLTPKFLAFEEAARNEADPDKRFAIWQEKYGFAAVPPGPKGQEMARALLDKAWPRYAAALPEIRQGAARMAPQVLSTLVEVSKLLGLEQPIDVRVVAYVGGFEDNAFTFGMNGQPVVNFPVESSPATLDLIEPHELTHAVHLKTANLPGGWERSIATTLFQEGLAMRVTQELRPGHPDSAYVSHRPGWLEEATAKKARILADMLPVLDRKDSDTVWRFTIDKGPAGIEREAYAAGWFVIGHLRDKGMSFAQIAHIPESEMPGVIRQAIAEMGVK